MIRRERAHRRPARRIIPPARPHELSAARRDVLADPLPPTPLWLANLELHLLEPLLRRSDRPPLVLASGLLERQTLGGARRAVVNGWAAELVER